MNVTYSAKQVKKTKSNMKNKLITVAQAQKILHEHLLFLPTCKLPLAQCIGKKLVADIIADRQHPPYDRVAMDGIAVSSLSLQKQDEFIIQAIQGAGQAPLTLEKSSHCIEVTTGACLPTGTDTVIQYEKLHLAEGKAKLNCSKDSLAKKNIHFQGSDYSKDALLVPKGTVLNSTHIAIAASVGQVELEVFSLPKIALVSTGDEILPAETKNLEDWQIRGSNFVAIAADLASLGFGDITSLHLADDYHKLKESLEEVLVQNDVILLSGGVSMGKFDFVPQVLQDLGVEEIFHKIRQKPGKPLWFGRNASKVVFGLPGNPVSSLICFRRYVQDYLYACQEINISCKKVFFDEEVKFKNDFSLFLPVVLQGGQAKLVQGNGSGDFASLASSDGFIELCPSSWGTKEVSFYSWN